MNGGNFTHKAQEAILMSQNIAKQQGRQQIDAVYLLLALLSRERSLLLAVLQKLGVMFERLKIRQNRPVKFQ